jgi:hypothetical protein
MSEMTREEWLAEVERYLDRTGFPMHLQGVPGPEADRLIREAKRLIESQA